MSSCCMSVLADIKRKCITTLQGYLYYSKLGVEYIQAMNK